MAVAADAESANGTDDCCNDGHCQCGVVGHAPVPASRLLKVTLPGSAPPGGMPGTGERLAHASQIYRPPIA